MRDFLTFMKGFWVLTVSYLVALFSSKWVLSILGLEQADWEDFKFADTYIFAPIVTGAILLVGIFILILFYYACMGIGKQLNKRGQ